LLVVAASGASDGGSLAAGEVLLFIGALLAALVGAIGGTVAGRLGAKSMRQEAERAARRNAYELVLQNCNEVCRWSVRACSDPNTPLPSSDARLLAQARIDLHGSDGVRSSYAAFAKGFERLYEEVRQSRAHESTSQGREEGLKTGGSELLSALERLTQAMRDDVRIEV
jgi:hypothetical protein